MTGVREAVQKATAFVEDLYPEAKDIRLEEVERNPSEWSVVISFRTGEPSTLASVMGGDPRLFKTVVIDTNNGEPLALKVWKN